MKQCYPLVSNRLCLGLHISMQERLSLTVHLLCAHVPQLVVATLAATHLCCRRCVADRAADSSPRQYINPSIYRQNVQAFITYGRQGNDRLLQFYGFVEADNPADTYVVCNLDSAIEVTPPHRVCHNCIGQSRHSIALPAMTKARTTSALRCRRLDCVLCR
jgi:hypothetical protein